MFKQYQDCVQDSVVRQQKYQDEAAAYRLAQDINAQKPPVFHVRLLARLGDLLIRSGEKLKAYHRPAAPTAHFEPGTSFGRLGQ